MQEEACVKYVWEYVNVCLNMHEGKEDRCVIDTSAWTRLKKWGVYEYIVSKMIYGVCICNLICVRYGIGALRLNTACVIRTCMNKEKGLCLMCESYRNGALCLIIMCGYRVYKKRCVIA